MIRKKRDLSPDAKLRFPDYLGYFFGAGTNIAGYIVSAFLLIYYSNVLYLGLTQVGVVMAISKCFDGVSDILMGRIIDKTKSKYGKARPWYLRMILPLSMCMLFLFWMPPGLSETWKYVYVFITYNLASTVFYCQCDCTFFHDWFYDHGYQVKRNRRSHEYDFQYSFYNSGYEFLYENL